MPIALKYEQIRGFNRFAGGDHEEYIPEEDLLDRTVSLLPVCQFFLDAIAVRRVFGNRSEDQGIRFPAKHVDSSGKLPDRTRRVGTEETQEVTSALSLYYLSRNDFQSICISEIL